MSDARAFQRAFGMLLDGGTTPEDPALRRAIAVHRNTSRKAALDALAANFPVLADMVGPDAFAACALAFIEHVPPADPRLCVYGDGFPAFVAEWPPFGDARYCAPVATLERLVVETLFAPNMVPLGSIADGLDLDMPLALHPATRIASFDCPAASFWLAHQAGSDLDLAAIAWRSEIALVTRPRFSVEVQVIDAATHAFLTASTLGEAAAAAHDQGGDVAAIFATLLTAGAFASSAPTETLHAD